jgi:hypothetical protein
LLHFLAGTLVSLLLSSPRFISCGLADDDGRDVDDDCDRLDDLLDGLVDHFGPNDPASERHVMTCD